jgi:hypothetical protein
MGDNTEYQYTRKLWDSYMLNLRSLNRFILIGLALFGLSVSSANAALCTDLTTDWDISLDFGSSPEITPADAPITNQYSNAGCKVDFKSKGNGLKRNPGGFLTGFNDFGNSFDILFSNDVTEAQFWFNTIPGESVFTILLSNGVPDIVPIETGGGAARTQVFKYPDLTFDQITVNVMAGNGNFQFDDLQFNEALPSAVPIPATVWLFGTALIGLIGFGKRRKAA